MRRRHLPMVEPVVEGDTVLEDGVRGMLVQLDRVIDHRRRSVTHQGRHVPCALGCDACCYHPAFVTVLELWTLFQTLRTWTPDAQNALKVRLRAAENRAKAEGVSLKRVTQEATGSARRVRYMAARIACPFLVGAKCAAYAHRPVGCRTRIVVDTDPKRCADPESEVLYLGTADLAWPLTRYLADRIRLKGEAQLAAACVVNLVVGLRGGWVLLDDPTLGFEAWVEQAPFVKEALERAHAFARTNPLQDVLRDSAADDPAVLSRTAGGGWLMC